MFGKKTSVKGAYGIIGLGRFGMALAEELANSGADLMVLDKDEEKVRQIREFTENAYVVKNIDRNSLADTGIQNCDVAIVCIGEHMDTSILATLYLVGLGIPKVISKATSPEHGEILTKLGAEVVYPEHDMAIRLAHRLESSRLLDYVQISEKLNISKLMIPASAAGETILSLDLRRNYGVNIIAIEHGRTLIENVDPSYTLQKDDILYVAGSRDSLTQLGDWASRG